MADNVLDYDGVRRPDLDYSATTPEGRLVPGQYDLAVQYALALNQKIKELSGQPNKGDQVEQVQTEAFRFLATLPRADGDAILTTVIDQSLSLRVTGIEARLKPK